MHRFPARAQPSGHLTGTWVQQPGKAGLGLAHASPGGHRAGGPRHSPAPPGLTPAAMWPPASLT